MTIRYPKGTPFSNHDAKPKKIQVEKKNIQFGNRGMNFEEEINQSNEYYLNHGVAVIHKKPTPIQIVAVDYPRRSAAVIREAYFRHASTTDYNGVFNGQYIDFEAKETQNKTSFPLKNFSEHQILHMQQCTKQKGVCFVLLWFSIHNRCFLLGSEILIQFWMNQKNNGKKSIPLETIEKIGYEIFLGIAPRIPYLDVLKIYIHSLSEKGVSIHEE